MNCSSSSSSSSSSSASSSSPTPSFSILLPPPNITGALHLGHAYEHTSIDMLTRRESLRGGDPLMLPGLDHAGLATQALIERALASEGTSRAELGRTRFLERTWEHAGRSRATIISQMQALGTECDWDRLRFTLDPEHQRTTRDAFAQLFDEGLITRASASTWWCPRCDTALSDIEAESGECSRCLSPTERRTSEQWFLDLPALAHHGREALASGELELDPPELESAWLRWCDELEPWCISRQIWWGHPIPAWTDEAGTTRALASLQDPEPGWSADPDCLDTWFSSALWPMTLPGPSDLLITGRDLLFFWALRMTLLTRHLRGTAPFKRLHLHGMLRDEHGKKMSKSFGNAIDPLPIIERDGADTLRFALMHASRRAEAIPFGDADLERAKAFLRKLSSTTAFTLGFEPGPEGPACTQEPACAEHPLDRWLASRAEATRRTADAALEALDFGTFTSTIERFLTEDISATWIEASKSRRTPSAHRALRGAMTTLLGLLACLVPAAAAEHAAALGTSLAWPSAPAPGHDPSDPGLESLLEDFKEARTELRHQRRARGLARSEPLLGSICASGADARALAAELSAQARLSGTPGTDHSSRGAFTLLLEPTPRDDARLQKDLTAARSLAERLSTRLADPGFLAKAPAAALTRSRTDLERALTELARLEALLAS
jgi:valyl-tRNA synthetase